MGSHTERLSRGEIVSVGSVHAALRTLHGPDLTARRTPVEVVRSVAGFFGSLSLLLQAAWTQRRVVSVSHLACSGDFSAQMNEERGALRRITREKQPI